MPCGCGNGAASLPAGGPAPALGERGFILMRAFGATGTLFGPVTGTRYPFGTRPRMFVDRRDAVYLLGPEVHLA